MYTPSVSYVNERCIHAGTNAMHTQVSSCVYARAFTSKSEHEEDKRLIMEQVHHLVQRVEELESISPDPARGAGANLPPRRKTRDRCGEGYHQPQPSH